MYILNYLLIFFMSLLSNFIKSKKIICLIGVYLIVFSAFRKNIGPDYNSYELMFYSLKNNPEYFYMSRIEKFFLVLFNLGSQFHYSLFIIATISVTMRIKSIFKYSTFPEFSLLIYYCSFFLLDDMGRIRIGLGTSIVIYFLYLLTEKRYKAYLSLVLVCTFIHKSVLIYLLVFIINKIKLTKKFLFINLFFSLILGQINLHYYLFNMLLKISFLNKTLKTYADTNINKIGINSLVLIYLLFSLMMIFNFDHLNKNYKYFKVIFTHYYAGVCFYFLFNSFGPIAARGSEVLTSINFIILPYILKGNVLGRKNKKTEKILNYILINLYAIAIYIKLIHSPSYINYKSILFQ